MWKPLSGILFGFCLCGIQPMIAQAQLGSCSASYEFSCDNNRCIYDWFTCDGEDDCGDMSDEESCGPRTCGGRLTETSGVIYSPNYPFNYENNAKCTWIIQGPVGTAIRLDVTNFALQEAEYSYLQGGLACVDWLEILYSKSSDGGIFCGSDIFESYTSPENYLWIQFQSDQSIVRSGFRIEYSIESCSEYFHYQCSNGQCVSFLSECDGVDDCGDSSDELGCLTRECTSSEYECAVPDNRRCIRDWEQCDSYEDCGDGADEMNCQEPCDYLEFTCNNGQCIHEVFVCDGEDDCGDMSDELNCPPPTCGGQLTEISGTITSPSYPYYPNNARCTWIIQGPEGSVIELRFGSFSLQDSGYSYEQGDVVCYDWIEILDSKVSDDLVYCGTGTIPTYTTSGNYLWLQFRSDDAITKRGFSASYKMSGPCVDVTCYNGGTCVIDGRNSICQCGSVYTGHRCESAICNPPCQNGDCTTPNECKCDEGYSGAQCQTKITFLVVSSTIVLEEEFSSVLLDHTSTEYQELAKEFEMTMNQILLNYFGDAFDRCDVTAFRSGSVKVDFDVHFHDSPDDITDPSDLEEEIEMRVEEAITEASDTGSLGRFNVVPGSVSVNSVSRSREDDKEEKNFVEDNWKVIPAVAGCAVVVVIVAIWQIRKCQKKSASETNQEPSVQYMPKGTTFQNTGGNADGHRRNTYEHQQSTGDFSDWRNIAFTGTLSDRPPVPNPRPDHADQQSNNGYYSSLMS